MTEAQDTLYGYVRETSEVVDIEQGLYFKPSQKMLKKYYTEWMKFWFMEVKEGKFITKN